MNIIGVFVVTLRRCLVTGYCTNDRNNCCRSGCVVRRRLWLLVLSKSAVAAAAGPSPLTPQFKPTRLLYINTQRTVYLQRMFNSTITSKTKYGESAYQYNGDIEDLAI